MFTLPTHDIELGGTAAHFKGDKAFSCHTNDILLLLIVNVLVYIIRETT